MPFVPLVKLLYLHASRVLPVDLSDPEATRASVDKAVKLFGKVDMLVNNAGTKVIGVVVHVTRVSCPTPFL